ncbi:hypothetical protein KFE25_000497 [Diacronema lutheri]|uniref:Uncharacterized protein n=2 Tax=Diacronema lutheri TaxID=2081491 RepID=A0A8J6CDK5_DIALT|nr:hypothetical protein KFE25_000497 [Diacronema lutheri]
MNPEAAPCVPTAFGEPGAPASEESAAPAHADEWPTEPEPGSLEEVRSAPNYADFEGVIKCVRSAAPVEELTALLAERQVDLSLAMPGSDDWRISYLTALVHEEGIEDASMAQCVALLVKHKADPNAVDGTGRTSLMYAAMRGQRAALQALLEHGADARATLDEGAECASALKCMGRTALELAVEEGHADCVRLLAERGAEVRLPVGRFGPLLLSCLLDRVDCCAALIAAHAAVNDVDKNGFTALMAAADSASARCVRTLLDARASHAAAEPSEGRTALMIAAQGTGGPHRLRWDLPTPPAGGYAECVHALLDAGADADTRSNSSGRCLTALLYAASNGNTAVVRALVARGGQVNGQRHVSSDGLSALALALVVGHEETARVLCASGAYPYSPREPRELLPPLLLGRNAGLADARKAALARMSLWMAARTGWRSPLHFAQQLTPDHARELLRAGADVSLAAVRRSATLADAAAAHDDTAAGQPDASASAETPAELARALIAQLERDGGAADCAEAQGDGTSDCAEAQGDGKSDSAEAQVARIIDAAARPWSPSTHALFPSRARARAVSLLLLGKLVARQYGGANGGVAAFELAWTAHVLPRVIERTLLEPGTRVRLVGLTGSSASALNGQVGTVQCASATEIASGRVPVLIGADASGGTSSARGGATSHGRVARRDSAPKASARRVGVRVHNLAVVRPFQPAPLGALEGGKTPSPEEWAKQWQHGRLYMTGRPGAPGADVA